MVRANKFVIFAMSWLITTQIVAQLSIQENLDIDLLVAIKYGNLEKAAEAIAAGADVQTDDNEAIVMATNIGDLAMTKLLADNGADIFARDDLPFRLAIDRGYRDIFELLIKAKMTQDCFSREIENQEFENALMIIFMEEKYKNAGQTKSYEEIRDLVCTRQQQELLDALLQRFF